MSKQISQYDLAHIFCRLMLDGEQFDSVTQLEAFMTEAAELVANHCGGVVTYKADTLDDKTYVSISSDESLPADGGIWQAYDLEGDLHNREDHEMVEDTSVVESLSTYVICRNCDQSKMPIIDTMWEVYFPDRLEKEYDDYLDCPEWKYLMDKASFTHCDVADLIIHVESVSKLNDVPGEIKNILDEAHSMEMTWILFHLGQ